MLECTVCEPGFLETDLLHLVQFHYLGFLVFLVTRAGVKPLSFAAACAMLQVKGYRGCRLTNDDYIPIKLDGLGPVDNRPSTN